jgi:hypothetical protein
MTVLPLPTENPILVLSLSLSLFLIHFHFVSVFVSISEFFLKNFTNFFCTLLKSGHVLNKVLKDIVNRYKVLRGYKVRSGSISQIRFFVFDFLNISQYNSIITLSFCLFDLHHLIHSLFYCVCDFVIIHLVMFLDGIVTDYQSNSKQWKGTKTAHSFH